jgi:hypothetical protein
MDGGVSAATVAVSASVSVVTGYVGTLINYNRQRNRQARVYGLSLLAEIKSLQRIFRRHFQLLEAGSLESGIARVTAHFGTPDTTVFSNGSGNLGLFATRTAVEIIEFYSTVRTLACQAQLISQMRQDPVCDEAKLRVALAEHLWTMRLARHHSREVAAALRRDIPVTSSEAIGFAARRLMLAGRRLRRRWMLRAGAAAAGAASS